MKQPLKHLAVITALIITPLSSHGSLQMLMGGGGEPDPNAMDFPTFFAKAPSGKTIEASATFLSQGDGTRTLTLTSTITTFDSKKSSKGVTTLWKTKEEEDIARALLPSLNETPGADDVFEHFSTHIIEDLLGNYVLPKTEERINSSFVSELLKLPDPSKFFETFVEEDPPIESSSSLPKDSPQTLKRKSSELGGGDRPFKQRKKFTAKFTLDTLHASATRSAHAQTVLGHFLSEKDLKFTQTYLAESGFLQLTLESLTTPKEVLSNEFLMANARRVPIVEGAVIDELQGWLEKHCNALCKKHVLDKGGESLYH